MLEVNPSIEAVTGSGIRSGSKGHGEGEEEPELLNFYLSVATPLCCSPSPAETSVIKLRLQSPAPQRADQSGHYSGCPGVLRHQRTQFATAAVLHTLTSAPEPRQVVAAAVLKSGASD